MATDNRGPQVQATAVSFLVLSWVSVSLRCYVRIFMTRRFRLDDWLAALTLAVYTFYCSIVLLGVASGTGQHQMIWGGVISAQNTSDSFKWWYCGELSYTLSTWLIKLCIAVFLMQICVNRYHLAILWSVISIFTAYTIAYFFLAAFQCRPVSYFWTRYTGATGSYWTLGILPAFLIQNLNMNSRTRLSVAIILGIGAIGSAATIVRIPYIYHLSSLDFLYENAAVSIWSTVEVGLGLTASSMACLKPLFRAFLSKSTTLTSHGHSSSNSSRPSRQGFFRNNGSIKSQLTNYRSSAGKSITGTTAPANRSSLPDANLDGAIELTKNHAYVTV